MKQISLIAISIVYFLSCQTRQTNISVTDFPTINDTLPKTNKLFTTAEMQVSRAEIVLSSKLDTETVSTRLGIDFTGSLEFEAMEDSNLNRSSLKIFIDTNQYLTINLSEYDMPPPPVYLIDTIYDSIATEKRYSDWKERKKTLVRGFPLFIYNSSDSAVYLDHQDLKPFLIQEAKNKNGEWKPIEFWQYSWCGNSYETILLQPKHFALVKIIIYDGDFPTELRIKLKNGNNKFYSNTFRGKINLTQFDLPTDYNPKRVGQDEYLRSIFLDK